MRVTGTLWCIGDPAAGPTAFATGLFSDGDPAEVVFHVGVDPPQRWPAVQPGPLDRDSGYRSHTVTVLFDLDDVPAPGCDLELHLEAVSGPLPQIVAVLNGHAGDVWLDVARDLDPRRHFRSVVGGWMQVRVPVPAECLHRGENRLSLRTVCLDPVDVDELRPPVDAGGGSGFGSVLRWGSLALRRRDEPPPPIALELHPTALYRRTAAGLDEIVDVLVTGTAAAGTLEIELPDHIVSVPTSPIAFGRRRVRLAVPERPGPTPAVVRLTAGTQHVELATTLRPARKWTLHLMPHVHLDVGYTDYQGKVVELHSRNLDRVLALRRENDKYAFVVDGAFVIAKYLESRAPEATSELLEAIRAGHVGVNPLWFLFLTGVASLEECYRAGYYAERLRRELDIELDTANLTDVPSYSAALPSVLRDMGIEHFLGIANHTRAASPSTDELHHISPFRWAGPDGREVVTFLARHYSQLRYLAADPPTVAGCADGFSRLCAQFERDDYVPHHLPVVGINNDNEDLGHGEVDVVARWSAAYAWPRLQFSTSADYFHAVEPHRAELPLVTGDGGSYWEDGLGSQAAAVATYREAQTLLPTAEGLAAMLSFVSPALRPPVDVFDHGWEQLLLGCEHTWTSAHSVTRPHSHQAVDQLDWKVGQVRSAHRTALDESRRALSQLAELAPTSAPTVVVYNPLPWPRSGEITLDSDVRTPHRMWVADVPGFGYRVIPRAAPAMPATPVAAAVPGDGALDLGPYVASLVSGRVVGLQHRSTGRQLLDPRSAWALGEVLYVTGGGTEEGLGLGAEATSLFGVDWHHPAADLHVQPAAVSGPVEVSVDDASWALRLPWTAPTVRGHTVLRGRQDDDTVTVEVSLDKDAVRAKESVYVAFPFLATSPRWRYDRQQGWVDPTVDHQPGACHEWLTVQHAVLVDGADGGVAWSSAHAPLWCIDDVVRGRWPDRADPVSGTLLSWVMNNYWWTNYAGSQSGPLQLRYAFAPVARGDLAAAARLGRELRQPLLAQHVTRLDKMTDGGVLPPVGRLLTVEPGPGVTATVVAPRWHDGVLVRVQEVAGVDGRAQVWLPAGARRARLVDARERLVADLLPVDGAVHVDVGPYGVAHVLLERADRYEPMT